MPKYWNSVRYWRWAYFLYLPFTLYGIYKATEKLNEWLSRQPIFKKKSCANCYGSFVQMDDTVFCGCDGRTRSQAMVCSRWSDGCDVT